MNIENIEKIEVQEKAVQSLVDWLYPHQNRALNAEDNSYLIRYLLKEINDLKKQVKELQNK